MNVNIQLHKIREMYSSNVIKMGSSSVSVGWNTQHCQNLRFLKLATVIDPEFENYCVNDYGCGYGAMLQFLTRDLSHKIEVYNGYDISREMLDAAKTQLANAPCRLNLFESDTIQSVADYTFVSGTFNVRFDAERSDWEEFISQKLQEINTHSRKGFAFNLLTSYVDWEEPHLYYGDPCYWFDYCKKHFSKQVALLHDYPLWEWTIIVRIVD